MKIYKNMFYSLLLLVIFLVSNKTNSQELEILDDAYHFYVIGDWGRQGDYNQKVLADKMAELTNQIEPEFIISTGDNFYPNGVGSVNDRLWITSFEDIYRHTNLHCDWYVVLGNHDYRGNSQAQLDYSKISRRWKIPERYYSFTKEISDDNKADFIFIDTSPFIRDYHENYGKYGIKNQDTTKQYNWIKNSLAKSKNKWKFVIGHHSIYTGGKRQPGQPELIEKLVPMFEKNNVDAYICGHEHDLQVIRPEKQKVAYFVSGAGSEVRPTGSMPGSKFSISKQGFMIFSVLDNKTLVQVVDYEGKVVHKEVLLK